MLKFLLCVCFCFSLFAPTSRADILIFTVLPKSGQYKIWGDELAKGAEIAVDEINQAGGLNKQKIKLLTADDACSETLALSTAQMLALNHENKPSLVIGPYCSDGIENIAKTYKKAKIFQIVPAFLTTQQLSQNNSGLIKLFGNKEQAATDLFDFYNQNFAGENVALVSDAQNDSLAQNILETFTNHGKSTLIRQYNFETFRSLNELTDELKKQNQKVVLLFAKPKTAGKIIKKLKQIQSDVSFITSRYMATPDFFKHAEDYLDTTHFMSLPELEDKPQMAKEFVNLRLKGIELKGLNIYGYSAVKIWAELVKSSKTTNYNKLVAKIKKHGFKTSWGETFFNNTNINKPLKYSFYKYQGQEYVLE